MLRVLRRPFHRAVCIACLAAAAALALLAGNARADERHELEQVLEGLEHGIHALERLDRPHEREQLHRIAEEVRRQLHRREQHGDPDRDRHRPMDERQRQRAHQQLEVAHLALQSFRDARQHDRADLMERAIHARMLEIEGRDDPQARHMREQAPDREQLLRLVSEAAEMRQGKGQRHEAELLRRLLREIHDDRGGEDDRRQDRRGEQEPGSHRRGSDDPADERFRHLEERLSRLQSAVEELHRSINRMQQPRGPSRSGEQRKRREHDGKVRFWL